MVLTSMLPRAAAAGRFPGFPVTTIGREITHLRPPTPAHSQTGPAWPARPRKSLPRPPPARRAMGVHYATWTVGVESSGRSSSA